MGNPGFRSCTPKPFFKNDDELPIEVLKTSEIVALQSAESGEQFSPGSRRDMISFP